MRSVDFELLSAIGGMCFLSSCCWRALSVLSSRHLRWKSHQPSQKPGVCRCCCGTYIQPQPQKTYGRQHWRTVRWCSRCSLLHIVSAHCTTLRCKNPHVPAPHMSVCIWLGRKWTKLPKNRAKASFPPLVLLFCCHCLLHGMFRLHLWCLQAVVPRILETLSLCLLTLRFQ